MVGGHKPFGAGEPSDIFRVIDLFNGAGCFEPWNGVGAPRSLNVGAR